MQQLIQNHGITETIINDNNNILVNRTNWDANYDGNTANILVDANTNGKHNVYNIELDNDDLANILNMPSVDTPIDKRLMRDFKKTKKIKNRTPTPYMFDFDNNNSYSPLTHVSSPLPNQELVANSHQHFNTKMNTSTKRRRKYHSYKINRRTKRNNTNSNRKNKKHSRKTF